jgi:hypothetical protein
MKALWIVVAGLVVGCGLDDSNLGKHGFGSASMAITNAEGEGNVLRTGTAVSVSVNQDLKLASNTIYGVVVTNLRTGTEIGAANLLTDMSGLLTLNTVAHDIGEFDDVKETDTLAVRVIDASKKMLAEQLIPLTPHEVHFEGHGFTIDEVQPPHIFSADASGTSLNSFIVGALPDAGEVAAPIYVSGKGFPTEVTTVDLYIARDRDKWQGQKIPTTGETGYVFGPIQAKVDRGLLRPTKLDWAPTGKEIGAYDILVDVDRNGTFDYSFASKDAADGEAKVGLTLQYGAAWFRAKKAMVAAQLSADAAKAAAAAADSSAKQAEAAAVGGGTQAQQLAQQARQQATEAAAQLATATSAAAKAQQAFEQTLADDKTCEAQAAIADTAAKAAATAADAAGKLVKDTTAAAAAYKAAVAAAAASKHLLVNLAFDSSSRSGTWGNTYKQSSTIYSYVNPPVQSGSRHAWVTKTVVYHQGWQSFWNNPAKIQPGGQAGAGRIYIGDIVVQQTGGTTQHSCTNSPPIAIINPQVLPIDPVTPMKFDVIFDYNGDGYYDIGVDLLDVVATRTDGDLISAKDLVNVPDDQIFGFQVIK